MIHLVSQFMSTPRFAHYVVVLPILWVYQRTMFHELFFSSTSLLELSAYSDSDRRDILLIDAPTNRAGDLIDRRSTTSYYFFLGEIPSFRVQQETIPHFSL